MRIKSSFALSGLMAVAACSNGPSKDDVQKAETEMTSCATGVATAGAFKFDGIKAYPASAEVKTADFNVSYSLPDFSEKTFYKNKPVDAKVREATLTFSSIAGTQRVTLSGFRNYVTGETKQPKNEIIMGQDVGVEEYRDINLKIILNGLQDCANKRNKALHPEPK